MCSNESHSVLSLFIQFPMNQYCIGVFFDRNVSFKESSVTNYIVYLFSGGLSIEPAMPINIVSVLCSCFVLSFHPYKLITLDSLLLPGYSIHRTSVIFLFNVLAILSILFHKKYRRHPYSHMFILYFSVHKISCLQCLHYFALGSVVSILLHAYSVQRICRYAYAFVIAINTVCPWNCCFVNISACLFRSQMSRYSCFSYCFQYYFVYGSSV